MALQLLHPKETSTLLGVSMATLYRIKDSGRLPFYKINGALRFALNDLEKYLEGCRVELLKEDNASQKNAQ